MNEYGDYARPDAPGNTVRVREENDRKFWEYRKVSSTDRGIRVQEQQTAEGSKGKTVSDSTFHRDGTFHTLTEAYDDKTKVMSEEHERRRLDPEALKGPDWHGDTGYRDRFLKDNAGKALLEDRSKVVDMRDDPQARIYGTRTITAEGSEDRLSFVNLVKDGGKPVHGTTTVLEDGSSHRSSMRTSDGVEVSIRSGKALIEANGEKFELDVSATNPSAVGRTQAGKDSFANLRNALASASETMPELHLGAQGAFGGLDILNGAVTLSRAKNPGQVAGGVGNIASGLGTLSEAAGQAVHSTRLINVLGKGGKALGIVGAVTGSVDGMYKISGGDTVGGVFSLAGAAGTGIAIGGSLAGASASIPVAGWVVAGVAVTGGIGWDLYQSNQAAHHTEPLEF